MKAGRRTLTFNANESYARNLRKNDLGGVIFGCKNTTIKECLFKQLFGLPAQHFSYVKNIDPGLPLFLFNYSDRKLYGIFEAASPGQMNINPYGWTMDGSQRTFYPAQVQIRVRLNCEALREDQFRPIIADNYYNQNHFWFELDHTQVGKLMSSFASVAVSPSTYVPQNTQKWRAIFRVPPSADTVEGYEGFKPSDSEKQLALNPEHLDSPSMGYVEGTSEEKNEASQVLSSDFSCIIAQLVGEVKELKVFKAEQVQKMAYLEQRLIEAETEIFELKEHCMVLEGSPTPVAHDDATVKGLKDDCVTLEAPTSPIKAREDEATELIESLNELQLDSSDRLFLVGGFDGESWLSSLDLYFPSRDMIKSLKPMNSVRAYSSVAKLNEEIYVFGGGNSDTWCDTVEAYDQANDEWTSRPSLNAKRGSLAGVALHDKIFAIGGGDGVNCFSDVEMFDPDIGRWIPARSMLQKRFALAAVELNGVLYATGGYDGKEYMKSAERYDPREHSWMTIESMSTKRGSHSLVVMNEKIYALGGFDGSTTVASVDIYDPRKGTWTVGDSLKQPRGYGGAAAVKGLIYAIGGCDEDLIDTVERYEEGKGWQVTNLKSVGKRTFFSAIVL